MEIAESPGSNQDFSAERVQKTRNTDPMGNAVTLAKTYEQESGELAVMLTVLKDTITKQIRAIDNETYYDILYGMYVEDLKMSKVASMLNYSLRQTRRYYHRALEFFERKYGDEYRDMENPYKKYVHK